MLHFFLSHSKRWHTIQNWKLNGHNVRKLVSIQCVRKHGLEPNSSYFAECLMMGTHREKKKKSIQTKSFMSYYNIFFTRMVSFAPLHRITTCLSVWSHTNTEYTLGAKMSFQSSSSLTLFVTKCSSVFRWEYVPLCEGECLFEKEVSSIYVLFAIDILHIGHNSSYWCITCYWYIVCVCVCCVCKQIRRTCMKCMN